MSILQVRHLIFRDVCKTDMRWKTHNLFIHSEIIMDICYITYYKKRNIAFQYTSTWQNTHTSINNTTHTIQTHNLTQHNFTNQIQSYYYVILGETSSQTITNSRLAFIFPNGSISYNQTGVYFQSLTPTPMRVPNICSFDTLKNKMHNTFS